MATVNTSGKVKGLTAGMDTIRYVVTNSCGADTALFAVKVRPHGACTNGVVAISAAERPSLAIYPAPNRGEFAMKLSAAGNESARVIITDLLGEKVKDFIIVTNKETDVRLNVSPGIYFVSAILNNERLSAKMVVE